MYGVAVHSLQSCLVFTLCCQYCDPRTALPVPAAQILAYSGVQVKKKLTVCITPLSTCFNDQLSLKLRAKYHKICEFFSPFLGFSIILAFTGTSTRFITNGLPLSALLLYIRILWNTLYQPWALSSWDLLSWALISLQPGCGMLSLL